MRELYAILLYALGVLFPSIFILFFHELSHVKTFSTEGALGVGFLGGVIFVVAGLLISKVGWLWRIVLLILAFPAIALVMLAVAYASVSLGIVEFSI